MAARHSRRRSVVACGGRSKKTPRKALDDQYTHVRWVLGKPLGPASTALLRFRAKFS